MQGKFASVVFLMMGAQLAASLPCDAFGLGDHRRITNQAVSEFNDCFPGLIGTADRLVLVGSDLEEDINLLRKDLIYSHFFNPYKQLRMRRYDSSVRVSRLEEMIREDADEGDRGDLNVLTHMGHVIHHLQDMASPPHVVPVMHWLTDGFELYKFRGDISSGLSCADLVTGAEPDLDTLLVDTAKATLGAVDSERLQLDDLEIAGDAFWQKSDDDGFGQYGWLGNHFGDASFVVNGRQYSMPSGFYDGFKQAQLKLAVRSTEKALYWLLVVHGI